MNPIEIINKYYTVGSEGYNILLIHSRLVANEALKIAQAHPELQADEKFISEAAMLHDIGIFMTNAPEIGCYGEYPYICHGYLGSELLQKEGFPKHALVCERHTGTGLSQEDIERQNLPVPHRDMKPRSIEEQIICYADKFYSKTHPEKRKDTEKIRKSIGRYGIEALEQFDAWNKIFVLRN